MAAACSPTMRKAPSATSPASSIMRGPAASRYTGVGVALRFLRRVDVGPNSTVSPARSLRISRIASRMTATRARGFPILRVEMKPGATVRQVRPGAISSRLWASDSENERMANQRARGGGEQPQALRRPARQRQRQVSVPAAGRMIVDTDAVEACLLAAGDERGEVRQRSSNRDSEIDADPGHLRKAPLFSVPTIRSFLRNQNRAMRFLPRNAAVRARHWPDDRRCPLSR